MLSSASSNTICNLELNSRIRYRFSSKRSLYVRYRLDNRVPQLRQLQPFQDVSNPLNIITGNPALEPTNRHSLNLSFNNLNGTLPKEIASLTDLRILNLSFNRKKTTIDSKNIINNKLKEHFEFEIIKIKD